MIREAGGQTTWKIWSAAILRRFGSCQGLSLTVGQISLLGVAKAPISWPHAPSHHLSEAGTYFVTASTYLKKHHFRTAERLEVLHRGLLTVADTFGWKLEAWAAFSNHYHFIAHSPAGDENATSLRKMLTTLHRRTAIWINRLDQTPRRQVWHNFWDTKLTFERSYLARLNYVHQNPVMHKLVAGANQYRWCSAAWFEREASAAMVRTIYAFKIDRVTVDDDFAPVLPIAGKSGE